MSSIHNYSQRRSLETVHRLLDVVNSSARSAQKLQRETDREQDDLERLEEQHSPFGAPDLWAGAGYVVLLLLPAAVYFLDVVLFSPAVEFILMSAGTWSPGFMTVARFVVPLVIVLVELGLAAQIQFARSDSLGIGRNGELQKWIVIAVLLNLAIVGFVFVAQAAALEGRDLPDILSWPLLAALCTLVLVLHGLLLYSGRPLHEAKTWGAFKFLQRRRQRKIRRLERNREATETRTVEAFQAYLKRHRAYTETHGELEAGPFAASAVELLNTWAGREIVEVPGGNGYSPEGGQNTPAHGADSPPQEDRAEGSTRHRPDADRPHGNGNGFVDHELYELGELAASPNDFEDGADGFETDGSGQDPETDDTSSAGLTEAEERRRRDLDAEVQP